MEVDVRNKLVRSAEVPPSYLTVVSLTSARQGAESDSDARDRPVWLAGPLLVIGTA